MGYQSIQKGASRLLIFANMKAFIILCLAAAAYAEAEADADASAYYYGYYGHGLGHYGYGYGLGAYGLGYAGYYGYPGWGYHGHAALKSAPCVNSLNQPVPCAARKRRDAMPKPKPIPLICMPDTMVTDTDTVIPMLTVTDIPMLMPDTMVSMATG